MDDTNSEMIGHFLKCKMNCSAHTDNVYHHLMYYYVYINVLWVSGVHDLIAVLLCAYLSACALSHALYCMCMLR